MRYWQDKNNDKTNLLLVTNEAIYAQEITPSACAQQLSELNAGKSPATVFGKDATHIVLRSVRKVQQTHGEDDIEFVVREGKDEKTESISINDEQIRAEVYSAVELATQGRFQRFEDQYSPARAAFGNVVGLSIVGFISKIAASAAATIRSAEDYAVEGRRKGFKQLVVSVLDMLGPTGVWVIGGTLCALLAVSLYSRVSAPPLITILQAEAYKPQSPAVTGVKYLALAAVWLLFFPVLLR